MTEDVHIPLVLIVDDEAAALRLFRRYLEDIDIRIDVKTYADPEELLQDVKDKQLIPSLVISDMEMASMTGLAMSVKLRALLPVVKIIFITGGYPDELKAELVGQIVLDKPIKLAQFQAVVRQQLGLA